MNMATRTRLQAGTAASKKFALTPFETVLQHIKQGTTYSWDLTMLLSLGMPIPDNLRIKILQSGTSAVEAALVTSIYTRKLLGIPADSRNYVANAPAIKSMV
jgi:hypothetical protein